MSNIEFEKVYFDTGLNREKKYPFLIQLVLDTKLVKDEKGALYILMGVAVFALLLAGFILYSTFSPETKGRRLTPAEVKKADQEIRRQPVQDY